MLAAQLRRASEVSHHIVFEYLLEWGFSDLRPSQFDLFRFPGPHGRTPTQLAEHMGLSKQALNPLLNELQAMGYLTRVNTDHDKRARILTLTPRGLGLVAAIREALELLETRTRDQLGPQRYRTLLIALADIQALSNSKSTQQIG
jgi:DNA-binding MarR family transcriptional regulator